MDHNREVHQEKEEDLDQRLDRSNMQLLNELENAVVKGNIENLKQICKPFVAKSHAVLISLVILVCKHDKQNILAYLFDDTNRQCYLCTGVRKTVSPNDEDEARHNAFYYAIRSCNIELLYTLIHKWPDDYFAKQPAQLDELLSRSYEELKLKNVPLSVGMQIFVEDKLINLRFFSNDSKNQRAETNVNNIRERIELVVQNINLLRMEYSDVQEVDEKFLFLAKFIAQNLHILKRQLKSTYDTLPWEEIEFCLISFVFLHTKRHEINLFYDATLNKQRILHHLENFARKLQEVRSVTEGVNISQLANLPRLKREAAVAKIIQDNSEFGELYEHYQQIRDICSLMNINDYINLAVSVDPKKKHERLVIIRVLQVIGEYLKNTLESPKLSNATSELLLLSLPSNTRKVITDLRNTLSHSYSLAKRSEIEENTDINFFVGIQNDIKKVGGVITNILYNNKIRTIKILLEKIMSSNSLDEIRENFTVLGNVEYEDILSNCVGHYEAGEHKTLQTFIQKLRDKVTDLKAYERELFNKIDKAFKFPKSKSKNMQFDYVFGFATLKGVNCSLTGIKGDHNAIRSLKYRVNTLLKHFSSLIEADSLKEIAQLSSKIVNSVMSRIENNDLDEVHRLICEIVFSSELGTYNIKWFEALIEKLNKKAPTPTQGNSFKITDEKLSKHLALKIIELKNVLTNNALSDQLTENFPSYKSNRKLQTVIEMLLLDIMSILDESKNNCLQNNQFFLDNSTPLLIGKCFRNHLAHYNALVGILSSDPAITVILNARAVTEKNITGAKIKIGDVVKDDPSKVRDKFNRDLNIIINQRRMFIASEEGDLDDLKSCLKKGADIRATSINSRTVLHYAAKGTSLEVIKFILAQKVNPNVKDVNDQSPLHVAAAYGRDGIVEYLVKKAKLNVDDPDKWHRTTLHLAAQNGHEATVKILLKSNAKTNSKDHTGSSPVHLAVKNNHVKIVKILLEQEADVDVNEVKGGFTSLHIASENGHLDIVDFLLNNKANVNARIDKQATPLHTASLNGHLDIVNALISKGANVNAGDLYACTALHFAVENGHEKVAEVLVKHGADVNACDNFHNNTPLHYAAQDGHDKIVKILLENGAILNVATAGGVTPLHFAVLHGHLEIVCALLKHGADVNARDKRNVTPLNYACETGHKEIAELLLKSGADVNAKDEDNVTPLLAAALKGHRDVTHLLLTNNARVDAVDKLGRTPLHGAAEKGGTDILDLLIQNKAQVNVGYNNGGTPLYSAALYGQEDAIVFLIKNKAEVNAEAAYGSTPLLAAIMGGHKGAVELLIKNNAEMQAGIALCAAVEAAHKEIIEVLIANGANVNGRFENMTPLLLAIKKNRKDIVEILIARGADVNDGAPLQLALTAGYRDIAAILLQNKACINAKDSGGMTPLHHAVLQGFREIVNSLISRGAEVNARTTAKTTPLHFAAMKGYETIVELLAFKGADVNAKTDDGDSPLHGAAIFGHSNVVEVLLKKGANAEAKDVKMRTALELAVAYGRKGVVTALLQYQHVELDAKGNSNFTILHIASQENNLEMVRHLVNEGCDVNVKNASGSKPIHIAAREGHRDTVEFFLSRGMDTDDPGINNQTPLHYAAINGHIEVVKYLTTQGADVNAKDTNGVTPMHIAAMYGHKDVVEALLKNGAFYNVKDDFPRKPLDLARCKNVINLLVYTEKLFEAVKSNNGSEVRTFIKAGAAVDAKNADNAAPLHYAAWKGFEEIVDILLQNKADPNRVGKKGWTPLHYAAKYSYSKIVTALLSKGAVYDALSEAGKTPSDFAVEASVTSLFRLVSESFRSVKRGNSRVVNDLNKIKDIDTVKAVMNARNREHQTLVVAAMLSGFPKVKQLKEVSQGDVSSQIDVAHQLLIKGDYQRALSIFKGVFEKRKEILGDDNPGTLDIQTNIGMALYKLGNYEEALKIFEDNNQKQREALGANHQNTLSTRGSIALIFHRQGRNDEAFDIYQEVYLKQKELLGPRHSNTLNTRLHMALVLDRQGKFEEALDVNKSVFEIRRDTLGELNPATISAQNNIAMVLTNQKRYEEAKKIYEEVYLKKKLVLGDNHADTLRTLHNVALILMRQERYQEAVDALREILDIQEKYLGRAHPDTLNTRYNLGNTYFLQGKFISAHKVYSEDFDLRKAVLGASHPSVLDILSKTKVTDFGLKLDDSNLTHILQHLQDEINNAATKGDVRLVERLLKEGFDANSKDLEGRTPLHFAVSSGHLDVVNVLLKHGANVVQVTNKGNTTLHIAASKNYKTLVEVLLEHVSQDEVNSFVNASTTSGGMTSLHVAARAGFFQIVQSLLKHGAMYNAENKEGKTPADLSEDRKVINLLRSVDDLFALARTGDVALIDKLKERDSPEFLAATKARNNVGNTLLQVVIVYKHKNIASKLLALLKKVEEVPRSSCSSQK